MIAATPSILEFINNANRTFVIPVYQRNYSWKVENCEKLFDDLLHSTKTSKNHYFGNVVYYPVWADYASGYAELALIDGQQRITTVMLLLAAMRDVFNDDAITETYLVNSRGQEKNRVKLKQIESDRVVYEAIINGGFDESADSNIGRNYKVFKRLIKDSDVSEEDLLKAISRLEIVALDLQLADESKRSESPQIIFESINATGKPLSTADLLRNYLLMGIPTEEQERYYDGYWLPIEKGVGNDNISDFINKYLVMKLGDAVNRNHEYATFKKYLDRADISEAAALEDLTHYAKYYAWIQQPELAESFDSNSSMLSKRITVAERLTDLRELSTSSMAPLLLFLLEKADDDAVDFSKDELSEALFALESWAFRVRVSGTLTSGAFNTISSTSLLNALKRSKATNYHEQIIHALSNYRTQDIWPNDQTFAAAFQKYNFYKTYKNYVQRKLEQGRSNERHNWRPDSIEHIMPETLSVEWQKALGSNYATIHSTYLHTIGNLAPLNMTDNIDNSNDLFKDKLPKYRKADWFLTREIQHDAGNCRSWGEKQIQTRAQVLAETAQQVWRGPDLRTEPIEAEVRKKDDQRRIVPDLRACNTTFQIKVAGIKSRAVGHTIDLDAKMRIEFINGKPHYIVMAGSRVFPYAEAGKKPGKLGAVKKCGWHNEIVLEEDLSNFTSPSGASDFVFGNPANGWNEWKTAEGETLDEVVASDLERSYEDLSQ